MQRQLSTFLLVLSFALGAGCASVRTPPGPGTGLDVRQIDDWQARGRMGVSGPQGGGSGSFDWAQRGDRTELQIRGPAGVGSVRLQLRGQGAQPALRLETSDGRKLEAQAAWDELEARLGAAVPAGNLRYWMLGLAAPGEHRWLEPDSNVATLEQDGWRIVYQQYSTESGPRLPIKMNASNGDTRVRIVVDRWRLGQ